MSSPKTAADSLGIRTTRDPVTTRKQSKGKRTGLGVCGFFIYLFELNELLPKDRKMTDAEIVRQCRIEFPNRDGIQRLTVSGNMPVEGSNAKGPSVGHWRCRYNGGYIPLDWISGIFDSATGKWHPRLKSYRYNENGDPIDGRTGRVIMGEPGKQHASQQIAIHKKPKQFKLQDLAQKHRHGRKTLEKGGTKSRKPVRSTS